MATKITNGLDLLKTNLTQAVIHPISGAHPSNPEEGQIWYRSDDDRLYIETTAGVKGLAFTSDGSTGVLESAFDANTILAATTDDTPAALTIPEQTLVGRITGGDIDALTIAEVRTLLNVEAGATADQTASEILTALLTVDGSGSGLDADTVHGTSGSDLATQTYVDNAVAGLVDSAPGTLDTLNELAASLNDDADFAGTMTTALAGKTGKYTTTIGDTSSTSIAVNHGLNTRDVVVSVRETSGHAMVIADWTATSTTTVTFNFNTAPGNNEYTVVIVG